MRPGQRILARFACTAALVLLSVPGVLLQMGCSKSLKTSAMPPSVIVLLNDSDKDEGGQSHGIWVGHQILTVLHSIAEDTVPPSEIGINSRYLDTSLMESGDVATYTSRRDIRSFWPYVPSTMEDWAIFGVNERSPFSTDSVSMGESRARVGETLYAVGYDSSDPGSGLTAVPLKVVKVYEDARTTSSRLIAARYSSSVLGPGWSGCFVGRYIEGDDRWEFVGILIGRTVLRGEYAVNILRPPQEAIDRFFDQGGITLAE